MPDQDKYLPLYLTDPSQEERKVPDYDEQILMSVAFFLIKNKELNPAITLARLSELMMFAMIQGSQISSHNKLDQIGEISTFVEEQWEAPGFFIEIVQIEEDFNDYWKEQCREHLINEITFEHQHVIAGTLLDFESTPTSSEDLMDLMRKASVFEAMGRSMKLLMRVTLDSVAKESDIEILDERNGKFEVFDPKNTEISYTAIGGKPRIRFRNNGGGMGFFQAFGPGQNNF